MVRLYASNETLWEGTTMTWNRIQGYLVGGAIALAAVWLMANVAPSAVSAAFGISPRPSRLRLVA